MIPSPKDEPFQVDTIIEHQGDAYLIASDSSGFQLYRANIDPDGDVTLVSLVEFSRDSRAIPLFDLISTDDGVFFSASGGELWFTGGTRETTGLLAEFAGTPGNLLAYSTALNGGLLFTADDGGGTGEELWFSDGTSNGTFLVKDVSPAGASEIHAMKELGSKVFFVANQGELWTTDGSTDGTKMVRRIFAPAVTLNRNLTKTAIASNTYVAVAVTDIGRIDVVATHANGDAAASTVITGLRGAFVSSLTEIAGNVAIGHQIFESNAVGNVTRLMLVDPITGSKDVLASNFDNNDSFQEITNFGGRLVLVGPRLGDVPRRQLWSSDLTPSGTLPIGITATATTVTATVRAARHDGQITVDDLGGTSLWARNIQLGSTNDLFTIDLTGNPSELATLRSLFELGYRSIAVTLSSNGTATVETADPARGTGLYVTRRDGVLGNLLDSEGRLIATGFASRDLRDLAAGTYFLSVSRQNPGAASDEIPLNIIIDAPAIGDSHPNSDNDRIRGGDGDDVIVGGTGRDALYGDSGADSFFAERFEPRDAQSGEPIRDPRPEDLYASSISDQLARDPVVLVNPSSLPPGAVEFNDLPLARVVGETLGVPVVVDASGNPRFAREVRVSELAGITRLDASGVGGFAGLQYLIGLESLDLSESAMRNGGLARLAPANLNQQGMPFLRHLNLDGNELFSLDRLAGLSQLRVFSVSDQIDPTTPLGNLAALNSLTNLVYVDVSGNAIDDTRPLAALNQLRVADIADNPIIELGPLVGRYLVDDKTLEVQPAGAWTQNNDSDAVASAYQALNPDVTTAAGSAAWMFGKLAPGFYDVFAAWHADPTHSSRSGFQIRGQQTVNRSVNQRLTPGDVEFDGKSFALIGRVEADQNGEIRVTLTSSQSDGLVIADAVLIRETTGADDSLLRIDARGTLLDAVTRRFVVGDLVANGVVVDLTENLAPVWTGLGTSIVGTAIVVGATSVLELADLNDFASHPDGSALTFTAVSDHPGVSVSVTGANVRVEAAAAIARPVNLVLTATDADSQATEQRLTIGFGASIAQGTVRNGNSDPLEGAVVYGDANGNDQRDAGEAATTTGSDGTYRLALVGDNTIKLESQTHWLSVGPVQGYAVDGRALQVHTDQNFAIREAFTIDAIHSLPEGSTTTLSLAETLPGGTISWSVSGGPAVTNDDDPSKFLFTPLDDGVFNITVNYQSAAGLRYSRDQQIEVLPVAPLVDAGSDVSISEGRLILAREVIVDPGDDTWNLVIDYGDGSSDDLKDLTVRSALLDHVYPDAGTYTVLIKVDNDEGSSSDSFEVLVVAAAPMVELSVDPNAVAVAGQPAEVSLRVVDATFQADRFVWQYSIDWGDGVQQDVSSSLAFSDAEDRIVTGLPQHVYQGPGSYDVVLSVTDDDGDQASVIKRVFVGKAPTAIAVSLPATIEEDTAIALSAIVSGPDSPVGIAWDFGDGTPVVSGLNVTHQFADPGVYVVTTTASDNKGDVAILTQSITVVNVDDPPVVISVPRQRAVEGQSWSYPVFASDQDISNVLFSLENAPSGVTIDRDDGELSWIPSIDQGPARYDFTVVVTDPTGLRAETPVTIDVIDTGSISGQLFQDVNGNGTLDANDVVLAGATVRLDAGDNGSFDEQVVADALGRYSFTALPTGLYRVVVTLPDGWEPTTPSEVIVEMVTARDVEVTPIGGDDDSDGDGVGNFAEINSPQGPDANGDGVADWRQSHVVTATSPLAGSVTFVGPIGSTIRDVTFANPPVTTPPGNDFPLGAIRFSVDGLATGGSAVVDLLLHDNPSISTVFKFGPQIDNPLDSLYQAIGSQVLDDRLRITVQDGSISDLNPAEGDLAEQILPSSAASPWQNPLDVFDVDNNGRISALDALLVINRLASRGSVLPLINDEADRFYDVNGDGRGSALDALQVINAIARQRLQPRGESEQVIPPQRDEAIMTLLDELESRVTDPSRG